MHVQTIQVKRGILTNHTNGQATIGRSELKPLHLQGVESSGGGGVTINSYRSPQPIRSPGGPTAADRSSPIDMIGAGSPLSQSANSPLHSPSAVGQSQPSGGRVEAAYSPGAGGGSGGNFPGSQTELSKEFSKFSMVSGGRLFPIGLA